MTPLLLQLPVLLSTIGTTGTRGTRQKGGFQFIVDIYLCPHQNTQNPLKFVLNCFTSFFNHSPSGSAIKITKFYFKIKYRTAVHGLKIEFDFENYFSFSFSVNLTWLVITSQA